MSERPAALRVVERRRASSHLVNPARLTGKPAEATQPDAEPKQVSAEVTRATMPSDWSHAVSHGAETVEDLLVPSPRGGGNASASTAVEFFGPE